MSTFDILLGAFGAGIYAIVAVTHFDLWSRRRRSVGHLWLALTSAAALLVDVTGILTAFVSERLMAIVVALNFVGVAGATASLIELASALSGSATGKWFRRQQLVTLGLSPLASFIPALAPPVLASCALLIAASVVKAGAAARAERGARRVARAFLVLGALLLCDLAKELTRLPIPSNLPLLGFTILFLAAARSLHEQFERESDASRRDSLTGLPNRRHLLEAFEEALHRARRSGRPISIALADLDHFKRINDSLGHSAGDSVLVSVAGVLRSSLRGQDLVARWGGEEFMLLLPETDLAGARHVAEAARRAVAALAVPHASERVTLTLSLGVCEHDNDRPLEETVAGADEALYRAKAEGRNRVASSPA